MIRYLLLLFVSFFSFTFLSAQQWTGQWIIYPTIGSKYDKVVDTDSKVYFLNSGGLYSYDKDSKETYFYNTANKLSGSNIKDIYYNGDGKYMIIVYSDNNMDMLYDDGKSYCLPDIKDANISEDKTINDVAFGKGCFAVATNFGVVIYDENKRQVKESGNYRTAVEAVAICGDNLLIYVPYRLLTAKISDRLNSLNNYKQIQGIYTDRMIDISDNKIAWKNCNNNCLNFTEIDFDNVDCNVISTGVSIGSKLNKWKDGFFFRSGDNILLYDNEGKETDRFALNEMLANGACGLWKDKSSVWFGGSQGTANMDMSGATPIVLSDWYKPESGSCGNVAYFYMSPDGERIYAGNLGPTITRKYLPHLAIMSTDGLGIPQTTDVIEGGEIRDVSLLEASANSKDVKDLQAYNKDKRMYGGVTRLAEDPTDPDTYYIGNGLEGLYVVKDGKEVWKFNVDNAPFESYWETRVFDVNFDPQGNMWVGHAHSTPDYPAYIILPAAKLHKDFDKIVNSDWLLPDLKDFSAGNKDFISLFCKKSNYAFFINGSAKGIYVLDTNGTYDNVKDDACYNFTVITDQDGNSFQPLNYFAMAEDQQGRVWMGSSQGIFYLNAASGIDDNTLVVRPKVPRNDGTNYADFLLDSDQINSIAVDPSNRKWIATDYSGVYLVSENGDKIINHFDTSNSPLPTNRVTAVACDPFSNTVYFGTMEGLLAYKSDSSPAHDDFSEVYAYPNPVRPDYTGWITIAGLMDNSLVKIADSAGNVLYQGRSEGGMLSWDGCNSAGERVRTGIYYVYVSAGGDGQSSSGAVTKIMVVN